MPQKPSIPKGTRDFSPEEMVRRNFIFDHITNVFRRHGYLPIETPAMENLSSLLGKYGEEGDKLLFRILNSGDFLAGTDPDEMKQLASSQLAMKICEKGLRYDLTVPFARFVVMHRDELTFPFKRYQVQPVWRADKPQKGRYREFFQCDVDVIGSDSLLNEAELISIIDEVFAALGIGVVTRVNNRKILSGIAEAIGVPDRFNDITTAIDKLDKNSLDKVTDELQLRGIPVESIGKLIPFLLMEGNNGQKIAHLYSLFPETGTGATGVKEIEEVLSFAGNPEHGSKVMFDLRLARGLNYYTGTILEVSATGMAMGSICGGGRYDDLTGIFGLPGISGVGISFGADRIYDVMNELKLFPPAAFSGTTVMLANFGRKESLHCLQLAAHLRKKGISTEVYPEAAKLKKQLGYADKKGIPYVILVGENEMRTGIITVKEMQSGNQFAIGLEELIDKIERR